MLPLDEETRGLRESRREFREARHPPGGLDALTPWYSPAEVPDRVDKRDTERLTILGELHGEVMVFQPTTIKELSCGGAQLETALPLQLDSLHDFRLTLGERSVVVKGRVVHCSISDMDQEIVTYRSGIEFIEPSERVYSVISDFIDAIKAGRRGVV